MKIKVLALRRIYAALGSRRLMLTQHMYDIYDSGAMLLGKHDKNASVDIKGIAYRNLIFLYYA